MNTEDKSIYHDSAIKHVSGKSIYINDMQAASGMLYGKVVYLSLIHI